MAESFNKAVLKTSSLGYVQTFLAKSGAGVLYSFNVYSVSGQYIQIHDRFTQTGGPVYTARVAADSNLAYNFTKGAQFSTGILFSTSLNPQNTDSTGSANAYFTVEYI